MEYTDNDTENAVKFSYCLAGARHMLGMINGLGERCENANLMSIIPTQFQKKHEKFDLNIKENHLTNCSDF